MARQLVALCIGIALIAAPGLAGVYTWDGAPDGGGTSPDGNWTTAANWVGDTAPVDGTFHNYQFGGTTNLTSNNNLPPTSGGVNVDDITFLAGAGSFTITGGYLDMLGTTSNSDTADIVNNSASTQTITLRTHARPDFTTEMVFNTAAGSINMAGDVTDISDVPSHIIRKTGPHTLTLSGNNTYRGQTIVDDGVLRVESNTALGSTAVGTTVHTGDARLDLAGGVTVAEPIAFVDGQANPSSLLNVSGTNTLSGPITTTSIRMVANGGSTLNFTGGVTGTNPFFVVNANGTIAFSANPVDLGASGHFWADSNGLTVLGVAGNTWGTTTFSNGTMRMDVANALPATTNLRIGRIHYGPDATLDLNGFDQTVGRLEMAGSTAAPVAITSATPATLTVNQSAGTTYDGALTGVVALTKSGTGSLTLAGSDPNTSTGLTTVSGGTLYLTKTGGANAIGGNLLINGGTVHFSGSNQVADTADITIDSGIMRTNTDTIRNLTINASAHGTTYFHRLNITDTCRVTGGTPFIGSGTTTTANAVEISGGGIIEMAANSDATIFNIGSGGLTLSDGTMRMGYSGLPSPMVAQVNLGGDLTGSGTSAIDYLTTDGARLLDLQGATRTFNITTGTTTISTTIQNGGVNKTGGGTLRFIGSIPNTYAGPTTVNGGTLRLGKSSGVNAVPGDIVVNSGLLVLDNTHQIPDAASITTHGSARFDNGQRADTLANVTLNSSASDPNTNRVSNLNITGALTITDGAVGLNSGTNTTANAMAMSGGSRIDFAANIGDTILNIGGGGLTMDGATIRLGWSGLGSPFTAGVNLGGDFTGSGTNSLVYLTTDGARLLDLQGATRTFSITSGTTTIDPTIQNGGLAKTGGGTLVLNAANSYAGPTTIGGGTLDLNGSIANSPVITVGPGATFDVAGVAGGFILGAGQTLTGAGTVVGTVSVDGTVSPGMCPGTLTTGSETWNGGGSYTWEINQAASAQGTDPGWDWLDIQGALDILATAGNPFEIDILSLALDNSAEAVHDFNPNLLQSWTIVTATDGVTGFDATKFVLDDSGFQGGLAGDWFRIGLDDTGGSIVLTYAVPEPATMSLLGLGSLLLAARRRRRRND